MSAVRFVLWLLAGTALTVAIFLSPVFFWGRPSHDVVATARSPDGRYVARLIESNGGATTSFWYDVEIKPTRGKAVTVVSAYGAVRSEDAYGMNLAWASDSELRVSYYRSKTIEVRSPVAVAGRTFTVLAESGVIDPAAPMGGMLYNLQGRPHDRIGS